MSFVLSWGELLWDLFDDGPRLGGCAANVAYHLAILGQPVKLISRVGRDELGTRALQELNAANVDVSLVQCDDEQPTGSVHVDVSGPEPRYTIAQRVAWDRIELTEPVERALSDCSALVYGTLAQRTPLARGRWQRAIERLPRSALKVCDLNLRRPQALDDVVRASARAADLVKLNQEETEVLKTLVDTRDPIEWLLHECDVRVVVQTRGALGSATFTHSGHFTSPPSPVPHGQGDPVGAGDAYCARLVHGLRIDESLEQACLAANRYAARVASLPGATPDQELLRS